MGLIWLQTTDGKLIHLPVVGADINSPEAPVKIPASVMVTGKNRCMSGQYTINIPTIGSVTINLDPIGRSGDCNQCGQCCTHNIAACVDLLCGYVVDMVNGVHKCQYLTILTGGNNGLGRNNGTECSIRTNILDIFKGCILFPENASQIANCPACTFIFTE
jgi:hypothetical protein